MGPSDQPRIHFLFLHLGGFADFLATHICIDKLLQAKDQIGPKVNSCFSAAVKATE